MSAVSSMIRVEGVDLAHGSNVVLREVSLEIAAGEFWFLVGPNGAGKTTLLSAILGELRPRRGSIRLDASLGGRTGVGFVPQRCEIRRALPTTVREFVTLGLVGLRVGRRERAERLAEALRRVGLDGMERRDYWSLSGGQRQRVLVARALVRRPRLLLLDEPVAGLDPAATEALLRTLGALEREEGLTVLAVSHDLALAVRYGSRFALCAGGRVITGGVDDVLDREHLRRAYGVDLEVVRRDDGVSSLRWGAPGGAS